LLSQLLKLAFDAIPFRLYAAILASELAQTVSENSADSVALLKRVLADDQQEQKADEQFLAGFRSRDFLAFSNKRNGR
jgi:hypothetical protein